MHRLSCREITARLETHRDWVEGLNGIKRLRAQKLMSIQSRCLAPAYVNWQTHCRRRDDHGQTAVWTSSECEGV